MSGTFIPSTMLILKVCHQVSTRTSFIHPPLDGLRLFTALVSYDQAAVTFSTCLLGVCPHLCYAHMQGGAAGSGVYSLCRCGPSTALQHLHRHCQACCFSGCFNGTENIQVFCLLKSKGHDTYIIYLSYIYKHTHSYFM